MLVQRCALEQHRLILAVSVTKPVFHSDSFHPGLNRSEYSALVDTGAQRSVLSRSLILQEQLVRIGHMQFSGLHGAQTHSRFLAAIGIWVGRVNDAPFDSEFRNAEQSLFNFEIPFEVVDMQDNLNFDLILGFDVLKYLKFTFDNESQMFRVVMPS